MEIISVKFQEDVLKHIDNSIEQHNFNSRTEFIREAIRDKIRDIEKEEAILRTRNLYGASKRKTTDAQLHEAGERAFEELDKEIK